MHKLIYATSNPGKLAEAKLFLGDVVSSTSLSIDEIQDLEPKNVALAKAREYFKQLHQPLIAEDVALTFLGMGKLPGTYIKDFEVSLGLEGLIKLAQTFTNTAALATNVIVYVNEQGEEFSFVGETKGEIVREARGTNGFGWDCIFQPAGSALTYAEMDPSQKLQYSHRGKALALLKTHLERVEKLTN